MKAEAEQMVENVQVSVDEVKSLVAKAIRKKSPVNREEIQNMIGKWEVNLIGIKDQLQAQKIRQAHDQLLSMQKQEKTQRDSLAAAVEQKPSAKKQYTVQIRNKFTNSLMLP